MLKKQLLLMLLMAFFAPVAMNGQTHNQRLNENFDGNGFQIHLDEFATDGWYAYNAGNGNNWKLLFDGGPTYAHSGNYCLTYDAFHSGYAADCYLVSEPFYVSSGMTELSVSLYEKVGYSIYPETFEVFFIKASDVTTLEGVASAPHYSAIQSNSYNNESYAQVSGSNTDTDLRRQYVRVVVHCTSAANMYRIFIDDITVTETISGYSSGGGCDYFEDFESYQGASYSTFGVFPPGWNYIWEGPVNAHGYPPLVASDEILVPGTPSSGNYLAFSASGYSSQNSYAIMPALPAGEAASHLSFKYKFETITVGELTYGVFNGPRYIILGEVQPGIHTNPGTVDVDLDVSQTAGKRIVFRWRVQGECYCCGIDDICVVTVPCSGPFITLTPDAATVFTGSTETLTATYGNVSGTPTINYTSSDTNVATVSGSGTTATVTAVAPGTATITVSMTYQETTYTATSTITVEDRSYCTPSFTNTTDYIANFTLGEINNNTGFSTNGYGDYTNLSASLEPGKTATASLTSSSGSGDHAAAVWIDFNDNHVFEDSERVGTQDNIGANATVSISFAIPSDAKVGYHRLRVVYQLNAPESINPCVSSYYGEGEDYTVAIVCSKQIQAYSSAEGVNDGWYLIATPMTGYDNHTVGTIVGMITADEGEGENIVHTYDLYCFDQAQDLEWRNFRAAPFFIINGQGYLYASKNGTTLTFAGTPYNGNGQVDLVYDSNAQNFAGWNLVGNPFLQPAYADRAYYALQNGSELISTAQSVAIGAMEGIFVTAEDPEDTSMTFSTEAPAKSAMLSMNITKNRNVIDRAIVRFGEGRQLPKFQLNPNNTKVYIPQNGKDYAVVSAEESMGEMPVNFKAEKSDSYTLSFNAEDATFGYLHLIDNMTGNDVDLLETPSYTFEAKTTDYANRFRLVFVAGSNNEDANDDNDFAFYSNGSWIINNASTGSGYEATLQVIDVNGRIIRSESINCCANVNLNVASGVYMLRLVNGDSVKTQKVVVR